MTGPFTDALTGLDGTADPVQPVAPSVVFADATADPAGQQSGPGAGDDWSSAWSSVPVPAPVVIDPQMLARAEAELARQAAKDRADRQHAQVARSDAARRSAAARSRTSAPTGPARPSGPTMMPPQVPTPIPRSNTSMVNTTQQPNRRTPSVRITRPTHTPSKGSAAWAVIVFIIIALIVSGVGSSILDAIRQLLNQ